LNGIQLEIKERIPMSRTHSKKSKVFILFPDGVGLRNFAFTRFKEIGEQQGFDITYWNNTIFPLKKN
jgi:hypothetical protein